MNTIMTNANGLKLPATASAGPGWLALGVWLAFLMLIPFYVFPSGLPQPADYLVVLFLGITVLSGLRIPHSSRTTLVWLAAFVAYTVILSAAMTIYLSDPPSSAKTPVWIAPFYYVFNGLLFLAFVSMSARGGERFLHWTLLGISASLIFQLVLSPIVLVSVGRQELFFNNPNQLGYYCLLATSIFALGAHYIRFPTWYQVVFYFAGLILTMLSLSKAATLGVALLAMLQLWRRPLFGVMFVLATTLVLMGSDLLEAQRASFIDRLAMLGQSTDDTFAARGYDRIPNHPEYWLFGAGEGANYRFKTMLELGEIHSTWGTIFFSYGIVGSLLFLAFLGSLFRRVRLADAIYLAPAVLYGVTHQGLRDSLFWLLLASMLAFNMIFSRRQH